MEECSSVKTHLTYHSWTSLEQAALHILNVNMNFAIATSCHSDFWQDLYSANSSSMKDNMSTVHKPPAHLLWFFPKDKKNWASQCIQMLRHLLHSDVLTWTICGHLLSAWGINQPCQKIIVLGPSHQTSIQFQQYLVLPNNGDQNSTTMLISQLWILQKQKYNK